MFDAPEPQRGFVTNRTIPHRRRYCERIDRARRGYRQRSSRRNSQSASSKCPDMTRHTSALIRTFHGTHGPRGRRCRETGHPGNGRRNRRQRVAHRRRWSRRAGSTFIGVVSRSLRRTISSAGVPGGPRRMKRLCESIIRRMEASTPPRCSAGRPKPWSLMLKN